MRGEGPAGSVRLWCAPGTEGGQSVGRQEPESDCGSDGNRVGTNRIVGFYS